MPFIRVRSKGGPDAEYDIGVEEAAAFPDLYDVVDAEPSEVNRPAFYPGLEISEPDPAPEPDPVVEPDPESSVGEPNKEND